VELRTINGELPDEIRQQYERFRGLSSAETQIERLYEPHSITVVCLEQPGGNLCGSIRLILKRSAVEKLPCEYAHIIEWLTDEAPIIADPDCMVEIPAIPDFMPLVEVGALKVASFLDLRVRGNLLSELMQIAYRTGLEIGGRCGLISCEINPALERLYVRNYGFEPAAIISYDLIRRYKLYYKWNTTIVPSYHTLRAVTYD